MRILLCGGVTDKLVVTMSAILRATGVKITDHADAVRPITDRLKSSAHTDDLNMIARCKMLMLL